LGLLATRMFSRMFRKRNSQSYRTRTANIAASL
jgi:hypothetical protein